MPRKEIVTRTKQVVDDDDDGEAANDTGGGPLFDTTGRTSDKQIDRIRVSRRDPEEGYLGDVEPDATEETIVQRWGGGTFRLEAKNGKSGMVQVRTMKIAGDPVFKSLSAEAAWRRQNGLPPRAQQGGGEGLGVRDLLVLLESIEGKRSKEAAEREDERRRRDEEREDRRRREEEENEKRRARDEADREERRRRQQQEDDERRERQHRQDLERIKADTDRALAAQQQMFSQTVAVMKQESKSDPVAQLLRGIELARTLGASGGGEGAEKMDPVTAILMRGPDLLRELRATAGAASDELREDEEEAEPVETAGPEALTLTGRTAKLLRAVAQKLANQGQDPEVALQRLALMFLRGAAKPASSTSAPAAAESLPPPPPPAMPAKPAAITPPHPPPPAAELPAAKKVAARPKAGESNGVRIKTAKPKTTTQRKPAAGGRS